MAVFTVNTTPAMGEWMILDAYNTDCSTSTDLLATKAGHSYLVKSITVTFFGATDKWFKIFNDTTLAIGPIELRGNQLWTVNYESPMVFTGAVKAQTESDKEIHITMSYRILPTP